jgi:CubicO group peptidase (beta-lactamase class C family)
MMRDYRVAAALSTAALSALAGCAGPGSKRSAAVGSAAGDAASVSNARTVDEIFAAYDRSDVPGASVLVVKEGQVVLSRSYGMADLEAGVPATEWTNYRLASLTKQFTAMAIMLLVDDGRLSYDDHVGERLPGFPAYGREIRLRHLLTHTSGLPDYEDFVPDTQTVQLKDRDVLAILQRASGTISAPGSAYHYSNSGYAVLALVVEATSGIPFARFLQERIFVPLGMESTVAFESGVSTVARRAFGYTAGPSRFARTDQSSTSAVLGDGGIYSSIHDLVRWDRALDAGTLVDAATMREAWTPATLADGSHTRYGFGWFVDRDADGLRLSHHGETRGFTNAILKYPERRVTVVVLTNRTGGDPLTLAQRVAERWRN